MDCDQCREVVSARLDGETSAAEDDAADTHLRSCPACRRHAERVAAVTRWVRIGTATAGPDLTDALVTRVLGPEPDIVPTPGLAPVVGTVVPAAACGCDASCRCGCQDGRACRCARGAA